MLFLTELCGGVAIQLHRRRCNIVRKITPLILGIRYVLTNWVLCNFFVVKRPSLRPTIDVYGMWLGLNCFKDDDVASRYTYTSITHATNFYRNRNLPCHPITVDFGLKNDFAHHHLDRFSRVCTSRPRSTAACFLRCLHVIFFWRQLWAYFGKTRLLFRDFGIR